MTIHKKSALKTRKCVKVLQSLPETDIVYLAGLIDGEGTISLRKMQNKQLRNFRLYPILEIVNTDELLISWLTQIFWQKAVEARNGDGRRYLRVHLTGFGIAPFLERLEPYLVAKKLQSQLVRKYIHLRRSQRWKEPPSPEMTEIYKDVRLLNSVGTGSRQLKESVRKKYSTTLPQPRIILLPTE